MQNFKTSMRAKLLAGLAAAGVVATNASAALTLPTTLDLGDFNGVAALLVVAGAAIWGVRKALKMIGV